MTPLGDRIRSKVAASWSKFEVQCTLTSKLQAVDPVTGGLTGTNSTSSYRASPVLNVSRDKVDGTTILETDSQIVLLAEDGKRAPAVDDTITINGDWRIVGVQTVRADDQLPVVYICVMRQ